MLKWLPIIFLAFPGISCLGDSKYVYLFTSAKERAIAGLERQKTRKVLANQEFRRTEVLFKKKVLSLDEYEQFGTAATLAALDYEIAELKVKQSALSLDLALALARNGQRIPLCRRKQQNDEDTVSKLLKRPKRVQIIPVFKEPSPSGTKLDVQPEPPPEPPPVIEPPEPPPVVDPPKPPPIEPPEPGPGPKPKPDPGPGPKPDPGPKPPGGGGNPPPKPPR